MKNDINKVNVLWTGGYDSSFRMVQLSKKDVIIQPYYLSDNRRSEDNELNAIAEITSDIKTKKETKCKILPLIVYKVSNVKKDKEITDAYNRLNSKYKHHLGSQYDWLARYAKEQEIEGLELGIQKSEDGAIPNLINKIGKIKQNNDGEITYYILDKEKTDPDLYKVLGQFHFPIPLFNITKIEMLTEYKKIGFEETIKKTWFCHRPINDEPCGLCRPCKSVMEQGMEFRLPKASLTRYKYSGFYEPFYRLKNGMLNRSKRLLSKIKKEG